MKDSNTEEIRETEYGCPVPPAELIYDGSPGVKGFLKIGEQIFGVLRDVAGLLPHENVLDVGCSTGRMAIPLTRFLTTGNYRGFDIIYKGIEWLTENIAPKYPNFAFSHADIYNKFYNPDGKCRAEDFRFPYDDGSFDLVFLTSVFTHMLPDGMTHYMAEIARVLKSGGRCFITYFIWNEESAAFNAAEKCFPVFGFHHGHWHTRWEHKPEAAVAYDEAWLMDLYEKSGLDVSKPVLYGGWCPRERFVTAQDVVVAYKR